MDALAIVKRHLAESAAVKLALGERNGAGIVAAARRVAELVAAGGKIMLCGNGGSAADSQHIAAEFTSRLRASMERPAIPAIALTTDTSFLTARGNDYGFDGVFERLVDGLGRAGDVLVAISTSGGSENVLRAVARAKDKGIFSIGLTGDTGGKLAQLADIVINVPSSSTQYIQESHIAIGHIVCELVEEMLYGRGSLGDADAERQTVRIGTSEE
jgi:D-sedoheptulose 7-phosphate isomerase